MSLIALRSPARALAFVVAVFAVSPVSAAEHDCEMSFRLSGWSAFYKQMNGEGTVRCDNGQSMRVTLSARGGGLTFGKSTIENGRGEFSGVRDIGEVLGSYASAEAHAGAVKSTRAQVVTKGEVSLALSGTGRGWDLGVAFGSFTIERAD